MFTLPFTNFAMVKICAASSCNNTSAKDRSLTWHNLPKDKWLRKHWRDLLGIRNDSAASQVCSSHFKLSDFINSKKALRTGTIPAFNLLSKTSCNNNFKDVEEVILLSSSEDEEEPAVIVPDVTRNKSRYLRDYTRKNVQKRVGTKPTSISSTKGDTRIEKQHLAGSFCYAEDTEEPADSNLKKNVSPFPIYLTSNNLHKRKDSLIIIRPENNLDLEMECYEELLSFKQETAYRKSRQNYDDIVKQIQSMKLKNSKVTYLNDFGLLPPISSEDLSDEDCDISDETSDLTPDLISDSSNAVSKTTKILSEAQLQTTGKSVAITPSTSPVSPSPLVNSTPDININLSSPLNTDDRTISPSAPVENVANFIKSVNKENKIVLPSAISTTPIISSSIIYTAPIKSSSTSSTTPLVSSSIISTTPVISLPNTSISISQPLMIQATTPIQLMPTISQQPSFLLTNSVTDCNNTSLYTPTSLLVPEKVLNSNSFKIVVDSKTGSILGTVVTDSTKNDSSCKVPEPSGCGKTIQLLKVSNFPPKPVLPTLLPTTVMPIKLISTTDKQPSRANADNVSKITEVPTTVSTLMAPEDINAKNNTKVSSTLQTPTPSVMLTLMPPKDINAKKNTEVSSTLPTPIPSMVLTLIAPEDINAKKNTNLSSTLLTPMPANEVSKSNDITIYDILSLTPQTMHRPDAGDSSSLYNKLQEDKYFNDPIQWLIKMKIIPAQPLCRSCSVGFLHLNRDVISVDGYRWICRNTRCLKRSDIHHFWFFDIFNLPLKKLFAIIYHWAVQTRIRTVLEKVGIDIYELRKVWTAIKEVCSRTLASKAGKLGGDGIRVEVGIIRIGRLFVLGAMDRITRLTRLKAFPSGIGWNSIDFKKSIEAWLNIHTNVISNNPIFNKLNSRQFNHILITELEEPSYLNNIDSVTRYLKKHILDVFGNYDVDHLQQNNLQRFLDELQWRERFGTSTENAFLHIFEDILEQSGQKFIFNDNKHEASSLQSACLNDPNQSTNSTKTNGIRAKRVRNFFEFSGESENSDPDYRPPDNSPLESSDSDSIPSGDGTIGTERRKVLRSRSCRKILKLSSDSEFGVTSDKNESSDQITKSPVKIVRNPLVTKTPVKNHESPVKNHKSPVTKSPVSNTNSQGRAAQKIPVTNDKNSDNRQVRIPTEILVPNLEKPTSEADRRGKREGNAKIDTSSNTPINRIVFGCGNYSRKTKGTNTKFFIFPNDLEMARVWANLCGRDDSFKISSGTNSTQTNGIRAKRVRNFFEFSSESENSDPDYRPPDNSPLESSDSDSIPSGNGTIGTERRKVLRSCRKILKLSSDSEFGVTSDKSESSDQVTKSPVKNHKSPITKSPLSNINTQDRAAQKIPVTNDKNSDNRQVRIPTEILVPNLEKPTSEAKRERNAKIDTSSNIPINRIGTNSTQTNGIRAKRVRNFFEFSSESENSDPDYRPPDNSPLQSNDSDSIPSGNGTIGTERRKVLRNCRTILKLSSAIEFGVTSDKSESTDQVTKSPVKIIINPLLTKSPVKNHKSPITKSAVTNDKNSDNRQVRIPTEILVPNLEKPTSEAKREGNAKIDTSSNIPINRIGTNSTQTNGIRAKRVRNFFEFSSESENSDPDYRPPDNSPLQSNDSDSIPSGNGTIGTERRKVLRSCRKILKLSCDSDFGVTSDKSESSDEVTKSPVKIVINPLVTKSPVKNHKSPITKSPISNINTQGRAAQKIPVTNDKNSDNRQVRIPTEILVPNLEKPTSEAKREGNAKIDTSSNIPINRIGTNSTQTNGIRAKRVRNFFEFSSESENSDPDYRPPDNSPLESSDSDSIPSGNGTIGTERRKVLRSCRKILKLSSDSEFGVTSDKSESNDEVTKSPVKIVINPLVTKSPVKNHKSPITKSPVSNINSQGRVAQKIPVTNDKNSDNRQVRIPTEILVPNLEKPTSEAKREGNAKIDTSSNIPINRIGTNSTQMNGIRAKRVRNFFEFSSESENSDPDYRPPDNSPLESSDSDSIPSGNGTIGTERRKVLRSCRKILKLSSDSEFGVTSQNESSDQVTKSPVKIVRNPLVTKSPVKNHKSPITKSPVSNINSQGRVAQKIPVTNDKNSDNRQVRIPTEILVPNLEKPTSEAKREGNAKIDTSSNIPINRIDPEVVVALEEYYYARKKSSKKLMKAETKGNFQFKCLICKKILENNIKVMKHINAHIENQRQCKPALSDLTQCKFCFREFDTPFSMQTHIEAVHLKKDSLVCRICSQEFKVLRKLSLHMKTNHHQSEMPYGCQVCQYRSSLHQDVIEHFHEIHHGTDKVLCHYCLKVFHIKFSNIGLGFIQNFFYHLHKHQLKSAMRKCCSCRLIFLTVEELKDHRSNDHKSMVDVKGVRSIKSTFVAPVEEYPEVKENNKTYPASVVNTKQVNTKPVPIVKNLEIPSHKCYECGRPLTENHFGRFLTCGSCNYATSCCKAFVDHMIVRHSKLKRTGKNSKTTSHKMKYRVKCSCGFSSVYGNSVARHLIACKKKTARVLTSTKSMVTVIKHSTSGQWHIENTPKHSQTSPLSSKRTKENVPNMENSLDYSGQQENTNDGISVNSVPGENSEQVHPTEQIVPVEITQSVNNEIACNEEITPDVPGQRRAVPSEDSDMLNALGLVRRLNSESSESTVGANDTPEDSKLDSLYCEIEVAETSCTNANAWEEIEIVEEEN